jgi:CNT family concentrative nucleoside transporter
MLAINVAAMLIAFLAFIAMFDFLLGFLVVGGAPMTLARVFGWVFAPVAVLMGVASQDVPMIGDLLGTKLVANEFVAYVKLTTEYREALEPRSYILATYALTGFANFASIGIQLGGIGAMAPSRRGDLARLGSRALLAGFIATLINASIAAVLL